MPGRPPPRRPSRPWRYALAALLLAAGTLALLVLLERLVRGAAGS